MNKEQILNDIENVKKAIFVIEQLLEDYEVCKNEVSKMTLEKMIMKHAVYISPTQSQQSQNPAQK